MSSQAPSLRVPDPGDEAVIRSLHTRWSALPDPGQASAAYPGLPSQYLIATLRAHPDAWAAWLTQGWVSDYCLQRVLSLRWRSDTDERETDATLQSWRRNAPLLVAHRPLGLDVVANIAAEIAHTARTEARDAQLFEVLCALLAASPPGTLWLTGEQILMLSEGQTVRLLPPELVQRLVGQTGLDAQVLAAVLGGRAHAIIQSTGLDAPRRAALGVVLDCQAAAHHWPPPEKDPIVLPETVVPGRVTPAGSTVFRVGSDHLFQSTFLSLDTGWEDLAWAWAHPAWRSVLVHSESVGLFSPMTPLWSDATRVQEALQVILQDAATIPSRQAAAIRQWLFRLAGAAPPLLWSQVLLTLPGDTEGLFQGWKLLRQRQRLSPNESWPAETWVLWLQCPESAIRLSAALLLEIVPVPEEGASSPSRRDVDCAARATGDRPPGFSPV